MSKINQNTEEYRLMAEEITKRVSNGCLLRNELGTWGGKRQKTIVFVFLSLLIPFDFEPRS